MEDRKFNLIFRIAVVVLLAVVQSVAQDSAEQLLYGDLIKDLEEGKPYDVPPSILDISEPDLPDLSQSNLLSLLRSAAEPEPASTSTWWKRQFGGLLCCNGPPPKRRNKPDDSREFLKWLMERFADNVMPLDGNAEDTKENVYPPYPRFFDSSSNQISHNVRSPSSMWRNEGRQESKRSRGYWDKRGKVAALFKRQQISGISGTQGGYQPPPPKRAVGVKGYRLRAREI